MADGCVEAMRACAAPKPKANVYSSGRRDFGLRSLARLGADAVTLVG